MTSSVPYTVTKYSELVLRTTPPRSPRHQLARPRLSLDDERFSEHSVIVVQAPPGFGKTTLLGQWRREYLARGAAVAWLTADDNDDRQRFLHGLVLAVRSSCARPGFGRLLLDEGASSRSGELEGITAWLAEVGQTSLDLVLMVDEADRLSPANTYSLTYLLHNITPNLRVIVGTRSSQNLAIDDLLTYGQCLALGPENLRLRLEETIALARTRFGAKIDADSAARLHEVTEGWPLGLQIVMAAVERASDACAVIASISLSLNGKDESFVGEMLSNLAGADADFLMRISVVDLIHPDLCRVLTDLKDAPERLARLVRDTPLFVGGDGNEWVRLHNLARDALRRRLTYLPPEQIVALHVSALEWLGAHGMVQEAARHAHAAGRNEVAYDLAEQCLYDAVTQGHQETVLKWLELLPEAELEKRPRLRLAGAWALALSERHVEAEILVGNLLDDPQADAALRYECALIVSGGAYFADDPDRCIALFALWTGVPPTRDPRLQQMRVNRLAAIAILTGDPAQARRHIQLASGSDFSNSYRYGTRWSHFMVGLSYLWEGQVLLGEDVLRPALESADTDLGRRHPLACMVAALLAAASYERDKLDSAAELLANRLDVLERVGTPETVLLGYRTAARIAAAKGIEHRALDLLEVLYAVGVARNLPRLCVASLGEQVRMHAGRFRSETCRALVQRIDDILAEHIPLKGALWCQGVALMQTLAHANAAIAAQEWRRAGEILLQASLAADAMKLGRWRIEIMALRAFITERMGGHGRPLLVEAMNLAQTYGLVRIFVDALPPLADWVQRVAEEEGVGTRIQTSRPVRVPVERPTSAPRALPCMVLTPKERIVLEHLARNKSNKEIAQAMEVGEETVKWHLKNLFGKLDAGNRKHVVRRAYLLGLLEDLG
jgi:LuxR family maltose regulon positive regulatory protein